jgi:multiple sugar transport system ATP-binding protein
VLVGVRPEHLRIDPAGAVRATVTLVEHLGHETLVHLRLGETAVAARLDAAEPTPERGDEVGLSVKEMHLHRFDPTTGQRVDA